MQLHGTCGISQLPIYDGDKVILFLLKENSQGNKTNVKGFVHSDSLYYPIAPAICGSYCNGSIVDIENTPTQILKHLMVNELTDKKLAGLLKELSKTRTSSIKFMFIHKTIYDNVLNAFGDKKSEFTNDDLLYNYIKSQVIDFINISRLFSENGEDVVPGQLLYHNYLEHTMLQELSYYTKLSTYKDCKELENDLLVGKVVELLVFMYAMEISRKLWSPQVGICSEYDSYKMANIISKFVCQKEIDKDGEDTIN